MRTLELILTLVLFLPMVACDKHATAKKEIQSSWEAYRAASENGDGAAAAELLSKPSLDRYTRLLKLALDAPAAECWKLSPSDMGEVAAMRTTYSRKDLKGLDGAGYTVKSIKEGHWFTYGPEWKLRSIRVSQSGDAATAVLCDPEAESDFRAKKFVGAFSRTARRINRTMESPPTFAAAFVKDGDLWKFDETAMLPDLDKEILQGAKDEQVSVRDFIALQTSQQDDPKQALKIWEPMKK